MDTKSIDKVTATNYIFFVSYWPLVLYYLFNAFLKLYIDFLS